ncbi:MAG: hypothetical protein C5B50_09495 [Verrucomicrobia bacterium]|nr:MAG: hypothetical protein C5B50_09495 [Verrucomicrobiota bacterium]
MEIALESSDVISRWQSRLLGNFNQAVEEWSAFVPALTRWEDEHLLDSPAAELLADHKTTIKRLIAFGKFIALGTEQPDFPDRRLAESVASTLLILEDKLRLWHGPPMSKADSDRILAACFPDEP